MPRPQIVRVDQELVVDRVLGAGAAWEPAA